MKRTQGHRSFLQVRFFFFVFLAEGFGKSLRISIVLTWFHRAFPGLHALVQGIMKLTCLVIRLISLVLQRYCKALGVLVQEFQDVGLRSGVGAAAAVVVSLIVAILSHSSRYGSWTLFAL